MSDPAVPDLAAPPPDLTAPVVALGASAGGLAALTAFFAALDPELAAAYVVIPHLAPEHPSGMVRLLARHTPLPVRAIEDGLTVSPGVVHVLPPGHLARLEAGRLRLRPDGSGPLGMPIDRFFVSLAADRGAEAVAIVLSGTGTDGARGVRAINRAGGLVYVQSPGDARFDGMPQGALATGVADRVSDAAALARALPQHLTERARRRPTPSRPPPIGAEPLLDLATLAQLADRLTPGGPVDFQQYSAAALRQGVLRRLAALGPDRAPIADIQDLFDAPGELDALRRALLDAPRAFEDDPHLFDVLETTLLPRLAAAGDDQPLRLWCVGCGTGEAAYTLAMCLLDALAHRRRPGAPIRIFATDPDPEALAAARRGTWPTAALDGLGPDRRARHFIPTSDGHRVARRLRAAIVFARHDLLRDPPFDGIDLIDCRGLLGALRPEARATALARLHAALRPDGLLITAPHDPIDRDAFEVVDTRAHVYRRLTLDDDHPTAHRLARARRGECCHPAPAPDTLAPDALRARIDTLERAIERLGAQNTELRALVDALSHPDPTGDRPRA